jgi:poly(A) polymerase
MQRVPRDELAELRREAARRRQSLDEPPPARSDPPWDVAPEIHELPVDPSLIDADAAKVVHRLARHGYEAYLVGGCVRDLLLGRRPKDFDVATSARPDDVRYLFRNSRIIGRRFRLVHVLFGEGRVIETATFRCKPQPDDDRFGDDLLIRDDNAFGEAHEDAARRDFTINGLFYDVHRARVLDWVGGMPDIERRTVDTIGDPIVRLQEDPVRMLRAIKFCARLDLGMAPRLYDAIVQCRGSLAMAARPRLFEELMRLLREGAAHRALWLLWETGVLDVLLPELSAFLSDDEEQAHVVWRTLSALDLRGAQHGSLDDIVLFAALLLEPLREACHGAPDRVEAAHEVLEPIIERIAVPRRIADAAQRIVAMMPRLEAGRVGRFTRTGLYPLAQEVLGLRQVACGQGELPEAAPPVAPARQRSPRRRRRRRES